MAALLKLDTETLLQLPSLRILTEADCDDRDILWSHCIFSDNMIASLSRLGILSRYFKHGKDDIFPILHPRYLTPTRLEETDSASLFRYMTTFSHILCHIQSTSFEIRRSVQAPTSNDQTADGDIFFNHVRTAMEMYEAWKSTLPHSLHCDDDKRFWRWCTLDRHDNGALESNDGDVTHAYDSYRLSIYIGFHGIMTLIGSATRLCRTRMTLHPSTFTIAQEFEVKSEISAIAIAEAARDILKEQQESRATFDYHPIMTIAQFGVGRWILDGIMSGVYGDVESRGLAKRRLRDLMEFSRLSGIWKGVRMEVNRFDAEVKRVLDLG
ncbi:hypothetical protein BC829DRAFT_406729 [Chytridium lagenaria]|nr:hypothetical protein BC829DRAFT_406729 [Chytridium lagenaria]